MTYPSYDVMNDAVMAHYQAGRFAEALEVLDAAGANFPAHEHMVLYLRSCLAARLGDTERAIGELRTALDRGHWYSEHVVRESPSWQVLQGLAEFEQLAARSIERYHTARVAPQVFVAEPAGAAGVALPLLVVLHGNGDNGQRALAGFQAANELGWRVAAIQSSQASSSATFNWDDQELAQREVIEQVSQLNQAYPLDGERLVLAGFSMGGQTALLLTLAGTVPARGFVLLGPGGTGLDEPARLVPLIEQGAALGLRGYLLTGEFDEPDVLAIADELVPLLNAHGVPCQRETLPGLRHEYPPEGRPILQRALAFIEHSKTQAEYV